MVRAIGSFVRNCEKAFYVGKRAALLDYKLDVLGVLNTASILDDEYHRIFISTAISFHQSGKTCTYCAPDYIPQTEVLI